MKAQVATLDDGGVLIELILPGKRFGICLEAEPTESSWYYVTRDGDDESAAFEPSQVAALEAWARHIAERKEQAKQ